MKLLLYVYAALQAALAIVFAVIGVALTWFAVRACAQAIAGTSGADDSAMLIEALGIAAVAVVALQISQTIVEEEVVRQAHVSAPTRVRRFLSRFVVVIAIALAIEGLVATMKGLHEDASVLPYAAAVIVAVAALMAAWGVFIRLNRVAEDIEPESMQHAKEEDRKIEG